MCWTCMNSLSRPTGLQGMFVPLAKGLGHPVHTAQDKTQYLPTK